MDIKESELIKQKGWKKAELKALRREVTEFEGEKLWYTVKNNKPAKFHTIFWTEIGVYYLEQYFIVKQNIDYAIKSVQETEKLFEKPFEDVAMTKGQFTSTVNNTRWIGRIVRNSYKNNRLVLVEHETGFCIIANCSDNMLYPKNRWVIVDTLNNKHSIRKPAFKIYEQAQKQKV